MPHRSVVSPIGLRLLRHIHGSAIRRAGATHYETLGVPTDADSKEIKKSFYSLSKTHHPDRNPNDPDASARFVKISEAYAVLGSPEKRHRYDREVLGARHSSPHRSHHGSYHSSGPAGGRPPSGLSRRRTHFQGPPPSFFRNGEWGNHTTKRQAAAEEAAANAQAAGQYAHQASQGGGGMGPGQAPFGNVNDVPHFDREGHLRTHTAHERRRRTRSSSHGVPTEPGRGTLVNFLFVGSIISLGIFIPSFIFEKFGGKRTRADK